MVEEYKDRITEWNNAINTLTRKEIAENEDAYLIKRKLYNNLVTKAYKLWGGEYRSDVGEIRNGFKYVDGDISDAVLLELIDVYEKITNTEIKDDLQKEISKSLSHAKFLGYNNKYKYVVKDTFINCANKWFYNYNLSNDKDNPDAMQLVYSIEVQMDVAEGKYSFTFYDNLKSSGRKISQSQL